MIPLLVAGRKREDAMPMIRYELGFSIRRLIRDSRSATLSTRLIGADGWPYGSLVAVAIAIDGSPLCCFLRCLTILVISSKIIALHYYSNEHRVILIRNVGPELPCLARSAVPKIQFMQSGFSISTRRLSSTLGLAILDFSK